MNTDRSLDRAKLCGGTSVNVFSFSRNALLEDMSVHCLDVPCS